MRSQYLATGGEALGLIVIDRLQRHRNDCLDVKGLVGSRYSGAGFVDGQLRVGCLALPVGQYRKNYAEEMGSSSKSGSGD